MPSSPSKPDARALFKRHFGYTPAHLTHVPGSLALLGEHTEEHHGLALAAAVGQYVQFAFAPRADGRIELISDAAPERERFWMSEFKPNPATPWADDVKAVLDQLRQRGVHFSGFNAAITSDTALRSGLNGADALAVATALSMRRLYPFRLTETGATIPPKRDARGELPPLEAEEKLSFAKLCAVARQRFTGGTASLLGPLASLFGKPWHLVSIDFRFLTLEVTPLIGEVLILAQPPTNLNPAPEHRGPADAGPEDTPESKVSLTSDGFRANCAAAAQKLGARSLRSVELRFLEANKARLSSVEHQCARHIVAEIARVVAAERALRDDDHRQLGQYMLDSQESASDFENRDTHESDLLIQLARAHPGCLGARRTGDLCISLVNYHQAESFMNHLTRAYEARTGNSLRPLVCQMVGGAG